MAGMFCSLEEAAQKLAKSEEEIKEMIKQGTLREFRDGPNLLLKVDEIEELAAREGIELPAEAPPEELQAPTPPVIVPTTLETELEEAEMEEPEIPELESLDMDSLEPDTEEADLDIPELEALEPAGAQGANLDMPELDSFEDDLSDLEMPELAALDSQDDPPALDAEDVLPIAEEPLAKEKPAKKKKAKAEKKKKAPKPRKQPRPRPVKARASAAPSLSFGEWFARGIRNDSLAAIIVLILILSVIIGLIVAAGLGANYAVENLL